LAGVCRIADGNEHSTIRSRCPAARQLVTLKDAADYITKLPKTEQHHPAWQAAVEGLILVAETDGRTMFAKDRRG
jgi:hypothetical protein